MAEMEHVVADAKVEVEAYTRNVLISSGLQNAAALPGEFGEIDDTPVLTVP